MRLGSWRRRHSSALRLIDVFAVLSLVEHTTAQNLYNVSLSDQSPAIHYEPSRSGPADQTWNLTYASSPWSNYTPQVIGSGPSAHHTTYVGASASISFLGTAAYILGSAADGAAKITIDGATTGVVSGRKGAVAVAEGLSEGFHTLQVEVVGRGGVNITGGVVTVNVGDTGSKVSNTTLDALWGTSSINAALDTSKGMWEVNTNAGGGGNTTQVPYNRIDTHTPYSTLTLQPPANTSLLLMYGSVNFDHGQYSVYLSSPGLSNSTTSPTETARNQTFSGRSPWTGLDEVVYFAKIDPTRMYRVTVTFLGNATEYWDFSRAVFLSTNGGGGSTSGSTAGIIAGSVIGGFAGATIIALLLWFCVFRKKRRQQHATDKLPETQPFEIEPYAEAPVTDAPEASGLLSWDDPSAAYQNAASGSHPSTYHDRRSSHVTPLPLAHPSMNGAHSTHAYESSQTASVPPSPYPTTLRGSYDSKRGSAVPPSPGMILANGHEEDGSIARGTAAGLGISASMEGGGGGREKARYSSGARGGLGADGQRFRQETDAGRLVVVPPSYDPRWAQDTGSARRGSAGTATANEGEEGEGGSRYPRDEGGGAAAR